MGAKPPAPPRFKPRGLGYLPDPPKLAGARADFNAADQLRAEPIPFEWSLSHLILSILDQGGLGSCVANAVMQAVRGSQVAQGALAPELGSRLWAYWLARLATHEERDDNGTFIRNAFAALVKNGFPPESAWPYTDEKDAHGDGKFQDRPPITADRLAFDQRLGDYHRIFETGPARIDAVKRAISQGWLVVFGCDVSEEFCRNDIEPTIPLDPPGDTGLGHAMLWDGYRGDDFSTVNSWGAGFGEGGRFKMSADYVLTTSDLWISRAAPLYTGRP